MAWIDKLVGRSPIGPMQEHMRAAVACAKEIVPLVDAMASGDAAPSVAAALRSTISSTERTTSSTRFAAICHAA